MKLQDLKEITRAEAGRGPSVKDWEAFPGEAQYAKILAKFGFKRQPSGAYYKTMTFGTIQFNKYGDWTHEGVDNGTEGGVNYEGTTPQTLDMHLTSLMGAPSKEIK